MPLMTHAELEPLQAARRIAEEHLDTIRAIAMARGNALRGDEAENNRYHRIADVVGALQTIYDAVSELEFEEEQPEEPAEPEPPEEPEDEDGEEDEDDEEEDEDEE